MRDLLLRGSTRCALRTQQAGSGGATGEVDTVVQQTSGRELIKPRCIGGAVGQADRIGVEVRAKLADTWRAPWCCVVAET